jgi:hypothetical protein
MPPPPASSGRIAYPAIGEERDLSPADCVDLHPRFAWAPEVGQSSRSARLHVDVVLSSERSLLWGYAET